MNNKRKSDCLLDTHFSNKKIQLDDELGEFQLCTYERADIQNEYLLGKGADGVVNGGLLEGKDVAIKYYNDSTSNVAEKETQILTSCSHKNVVSLVGIIRENDFITAIVMEKMDVNLGALFNKNKSIKIPHTIDILLQCSRGMQALHESLILHGDFKPHNLLYNFKSKSVKITDFGYSEILISNDQILEEYSKGTITYASPEIIQHNKASLLTDVYSFGITIAYLVNKQDPYPHIVLKEDSDTQNFFEGVIKDDNPLRPILSDNCPPILKELAGKCWTKVVDKRPNFKQITKELESLNSDYNKL